MAARVVVVEEPSQGAVSVARTARACNVSPRTVRRWIAAGLPVERTRGEREYRIRPADVRAWRATTQHTSDAPTISGQWNSGRRELLDSWTRACDEWLADKRDWDRRFEAARLPGNRLDPALGPELLAEEHRLRAEYDRLFCEEDGRWAPFFPAAVVAAIRSALRDHPAVTDDVLERLHEAVRAFLEARSDRAHGFPTVTREQRDTLRRIHDRTHALIEILAGPGVDTAVVQGLIGGWAHGLLRHVDNVDGLVEALIAFDHEVRSRLFDVERQTRPRGAPAKTELRRFTDDVLRICWGAGLCRGGAAAGPAARLVRVLLDAAGIEGQAVDARLLAPSVRAARAWHSPRAQQERDRRDREWSAIARTRSPQLSSRRPR